MRAALALAALTLPGCATLAAQGMSSGWVCAAAATDGLHHASAVRLLDARGRERERRVGWFRARGGDMIDARADWSGPRPWSPADAVFTFGIVTDGYADLPGFVRLYGNDRRFESGEVTGELRFLRVTGTQLATLRAPGSVGLMAFNRREELIAGSGMEWTEIDRGLALAREVDAQSLAAIATFNRSCKREESQA